MESIKHNAKRLNIPTNDAQDYVDEKIKAPVQLLYPRDTALDPQLVWRGKDADDSHDLVVDAPPLFIQEKIDPLVLVENLRDTAKNPEDEPELSLFDTFDGLDGRTVKFYQHQSQLVEPTILGDSLQ